MDARGQWAHWVGTPYEVLSAKRCAIAAIRYRELSTLLYGEDV